MTTNINYFDKNKSQFYKTLAFNERMAEYRRIYISDVLNHMKDNFVISDAQLHSVESKFTQSLREDSNYILHYSSDYWAKFIADAMELESIYR